MWLASFIYIVEFKEELIIKYKEIFFLHRDSPYLIDLEYWKSLKFEEVKQIKTSLIKQYDLVTNLIEKKKLYSKIQIIDICLKRNNPNKFFAKRSWSFYIIGIGCIMSSIFLSYKLILTATNPFEPVDISSSPIETTIPTPLPKSIVCQNAKRLSDILTETEMKNLLEMPAIIGDGLRRNPNNPLRSKICSFCSSGSQRRCTSDSTYEADKEYSICDSMKYQAVCQ
nr:hypothetical protein [Nostoc sp. ChiQUE02]